MRFHDLYLTGLSGTLGDLVPLDQLPPLDGSTVTGPAGQRSVSIAPGMSGPDLALQAARAAMSHRIHGSPPALDVHLHASIWRPGIEFWHAGAYVLSHLGIPAGPVLPTQINSMSNSCIAGVELAASLLTGRPDLRSVLITAGEVFGAPAFPHLNDLGLAYGDGGSALLIGRRSGLTRVLAASSWADPTLERLHRGATPPRPNGTTELAPVALRTRKRSYLATADTTAVRSRTTTGLSHVVQTVLTEINADLDDLSWILPPFYGRSLLHSQCLTPLGITEDRTRAELGYTVGHIGASDQAIALTDLAQRGAVRPGDLVLLLGIGLGMTWTAVALEITDQITATDAHLATASRADATA